MIDYDTMQTMGDFTETSAKVGGGGKRDNQHHLVIDGESGGHGAGLS